MPKKRSLRGQREPMHFEAFCETYNVKPLERVALVWHLAAFRARRTVEALLHVAPAKPRDAG